MNEILYCHKMNEAETEYAKGWNDCIDSIMQQTYEKSVRGTCMTDGFKVRFKDDNRGSYGQVYAVRELNGETEFLICRYRQWEWRNANEFIPVIKL